jgi:hypothetical protein
MQIKKVTRACLISPKRPGGNVIELNDEQCEDIISGDLTDKVK